MKTSLFSLVLMITAIVMLPCPRTLAQTQAEMNSEAVKDFEKADKKLNTLYKKVTAGMDDVAKEKFTKAQRAWVTFRDAQAEFEADESRGGTMAPLLYVMAKTGLTETRIIEFEAMLAAEKK